MKYRRIPLPALFLLSTAALLLPATAQTPSSAPAGPANPAMAAPSQVAAPPPVAEQLFSFKFEAADLDTVMETYCRWTDKIYLKTDAVKATITLRASSLTKLECIQVVDAILAMNNIALVPMDGRFVKVVQSADLTGHGLQINMDQEQEYTGTEKFVTQIIQLKNVQIPEVQAAVQHVLHTYGKILALQRSNSLMITDTEANVRRACELIEFIDQATAQIEPRIYEIKYAEAAEIAAKLKEIVTAAQVDQKTPTPIPVTGTAVRTPPGVIRAPQSAPTQAAFSQTESGSTAIIVGTVKFMADDRTNIIIIFSVKENFDFFDKIISVLDVEVEPATTFEVINLEYADASELSGTLNDLIGAASSSRSSSSSSTSPSGSSRSGTSSSSRTSSSRSTTPSSSSVSNVRVTPNASPTEETATIENLNRLSEDTKILADERSNSILLMGSKSDIAAIKEVIKSLDIMLEQVVIEAAIFEIGLNDDLRHGIDWLYRAAGDEKIAAWDGQSLVTNAIQNIASGALSYYQNIPNLNSKVLINLSKKDTDARLVSTPVIMTTDNTEATLSIGEQRPVVTSTDSYVSGSGSQRSNYEYKDIGIQLTVTPRINPQRFVVMEIHQKADDVGPIVTIDNNEVPVIFNREFDASIAVPDGGTVVLGGLMRTDVDDTVTKIPILGDIPLIGRYLFSSVHETENTTELIVLMTPYVMTDMDEMTGQTERLFKGTSLEQKDWGKNNWSGSKLRQIPDPEDEAATPQAAAEDVADEGAQPQTAVSEKQATSSDTAADKDKDELLQMLNNM